MITDSDHLMFASVDIPILDKELAADNILSLPNSVSFWSSKPDVGSSNLSGPAPIRRL